MDAQVTLVGLQVALALMLLVGVGLMGSTVWRLLDVDEGFRSERLLSFEFSLPQDIPRFDPRDDAGWRSHIVAAASFDDQLQQRVSALPGVEGIALSSGAILKHFEAVLGVEVERRGEAPASMGSAGVVPVSDDYFSMLEIPIVQGRTFTRSDGLSGQPVVVLSQTAAATYFPNEDPIGKRVTTSFAPSGRETAEVVGVVGDVIYTGPGQQRWPVLYYSLRERNGPRSAMVRTAGNPIETVALIRDAMGALDPTVAMRNVTTMDRMIAGSIGDRRLMFGLLAIFASITVVLAAVGTWGVVAYAVAVRQRELGLRMALGAQSRGVLGLVLRKSAITAFAGVAFGWAGAFVVGRVLETFLWNTSPHDLRVFLSGSGLLLLIVLLASYAPARRAVRVDPAEVLRAAE